MKRLGKYLLLTGVLTGILLRDPAVAQIKILPLGDSITQGADKQHNSYRRPLWQKLQASCYDVNFIGSQVVVGGNGSPLPPNPDFDLNHEGHSGWRADQLFTGIQNTGKGRLIQWLQFYTPDIVLLHIGTNDLFYCQSPTNVISDLPRIIALLRQDNPQVKILLAQIIPVGPERDPYCGDSFDTLVNQLNTLIPQFAQAQSTSTSPIIVVDQYTDFDAVNDLYDSIHPSETGEEKMAQAWYDALVPLLGPPSCTAP